MLHSKYRAAIAAGVLLLAMPALASCSTPPAPEPEEVIEGGTVTVRLLSDWGNPIDAGQSVSGQVGYSLSSAMYDRVVYYDALAGEYVPWLAESWEATPTSIVFTMRDDVTCSDGTALTPSAVQASFERFVSPELKSTWVVSTLGASGPFTFESDDEEGTFTVTSTKPNANLLWGFAAPQVGVICPAGLEPGADFATASYGSGAYVFDSAVQGDEYVVTKREDWNWGPLGMTSSDNGFPDEVIFKVVPNDTTVANQLLTGDVDITTIAGLDVARLGADPAFDQYIDNAGAPYLLMVSGAPGRAGEDEAVRQAIMTALDPADWTAAAGEPDAVISTNITGNPGLFCYVDLSSIMPEPDTEAAKEIMLDAGYELGADDQWVGENGAPLTLDIAGTTLTGSGAEYIADALQDAGFNAVLNITDQAGFAPRFRSGNFDVTIGVFPGEPGAPPDRRAQFMTGPTVAEGGANIIGYNDTELQGYAQDAIGATTLEDTCAAWEEFNRYSIEHSVVLPWASGVNHWFSPAGEFSYRTNGASLQVQFLRREAASDGE